MPPPMIQAPLRRTPSTAGWSIARASARAGTAAREPADADGRAALPRRILEPPGFERLDLTGSRARCPDRVGQRDVLGQCTPGSRRLEHRRWCGHHESKVSVAATIARSRARRLERSSPSCLRAARLRRCRGAPAARRRCDSSSSRLRGAVTAASSCRPATAAAALCPGPPSPESRSSLQSASLVRVSQISRARAFQATSILLPAQRRT